MKTGKKYNVSTNEDFEPGSEKTVLKNLLSIKKKDDIDTKEEIALAHAYQQLITHYSVNHQFTANDIKEMHAVWLSEIYPFAGQYRTVNMSKGEFPFAAASQIQSLMDSFEKEILSQYTPCNFKSKQEIIQTLAITHVELILIHPFREGNGRIARLFAILMALQAGLPILNFDAIKSKKIDDYILAVQAGLDQNYVPMETIFKLIIEDTLEKTKR